MRPDNGNREELKNIEQRVILVSRDQYLDYVCMELDASLMYPNRDCKERLLVHSWMCGHEFPELEI